MNDNLSNLLTVFDKKCHYIVNSFQLFSDQDDLLYFVGQSPQLREKGKNQNSYQYALSSLTSKEQCDENTTITNLTHKQNVQAFPTIFFKIKQNMQKMYNESIKNQTTQKNQKKTTINQNGPFQDNLMNKIKYYKPKKTSNYLFSLNALKQDFESYRNRDFTSKDKISFYQSYQSLHLKTKIRNQIKFKKSQFNEIYENNFVYSLQKCLMAPKKQKVKKQKSNQPYQ